MRATPETAQINHPHSSARKTAAGVIGSVGAQTTFGFGELPLSIFWRHPWQLTNATNVEWLLTPLVHTATSLWSMMSLPKPTARRFRSPSVPMDTARSNHPCAVARTCPALCSVKTTCSDGEKPACTASAPYQFSGRFEGDRSSHQHPLRKSSSLAACVTLSRLNWPKSSS